VNSPVTAAGGSVEVSTIVAALVPRVSHYPERSRAGLRPHLGRIVHQTHVVSSGFGSPQCSMRNRGGGIGPARNFTCNLSRRRVA
jgi:hypothetical protein